MAANERASAAAKRVASIVSEFYERDEMRKIPYHSIGVTGSAIAVSMLDMWQLPKPSQRQMAEQRYHLLMTVLAEIGKFHPCATWFHGLFKRVGTAHPRSAVSSRRTSPIPESMTPQSQLFAPFDVSASFDFVDMERLQMFDNFFLPTAF